VLALRAGGRAASDPLVTGSAAFVAAQQNDDGGFGFGRRGGRSGTDDTAAAVQALVAAGTAPRSATVRRAARFLVRSQRPDGGFPLVRGATSNAQSTAWAVQALVAAGRDLAKVRQGRSRTPLGYLRSLQADDGSVRYSRTSSQTPVWVTAQALTALARAPLPIGP
jgi:prenyltransferase beta subunit